MSYSNIIFAEEKQTWLVDTIRRHGRISLRDLSRIWQDNDTLNPEGCELTERTFHRHREEIDRVISIRPTNQKYRYPKSFDPEDFFRNSFGIFHSGEAPMNIKLKVSRNQRKYIKSLPLHSSQQHLEETEDYSVFSYRLCPDKEPSEAALSQGAFQDA